MVNLKSLRWQQRFENFASAFIQLQDAVERPSLSKLERSGLIQTFEFSFELAWKVLKDFLESEGIDAASPRQVIKEAYHFGFILHGDLWMDALENRNLLSHTYSEELAAEAAHRIRKTYFPIMNEFYIAFSGRKS